MALSLYDHIPCTGGAEPLFKEEMGFKQRLVMDWVHFLTHPLYDFEQVIWSLNALVPIHEKEVIMFSSLQDFF